VQAVITVIWVHHALLVGHGESDAKLMIGKMYMRPLSSGIASWV